MPNTTDPGNSKRGPGNPGKVTPARQNPYTGVQDRHTVSTNTRDGQPPQRKFRAGGRGNHPGD